MPKIKCVVVGDGNVGKTCLVVKLATNEFPSTIPTVFNIYSSKLDVDGTLVELELWDAGSSRKSLLKPISYMTEIFIVCFSLVNESSLEGVRKIWYPGIVNHSPNTPFILVGTKLDLSDEQFSKNEKEAYNTKIDALVKETGALSFIQCSAVTSVGLSDIIDEVIRIALWGDKKLSNWDKCNIT